MTDIEPRTTILPAAFYTTAFFLFTLAVTVVYAVVYVMTDMHLFWDGASISAAVAFGQPWHLFWCNFPGRFASYLLTDWPAGIFGDATGNWPHAVMLHAVLYICWPTVGVVTTRWLDCTNDRYFSALCNAATLTTPFYSYGFPTEIWISFALFWPALCSCACAETSSLRLVAFGLLLPLLVFTHETAILFLPLLAAVAIWFCRGTRRIFLLTAILAVAASWAAVETLAPVCLPWRPSALNMLTYRSIVNSVSVQIAAVFGAWLAARLLARKAKLDETKARYLTLVVCIAVFVVCADLTADKLHAQTRYLARVLVVAQTGILAGLGVGWSVLVSSEKLPSLVGRLRNIIVSTVIRHASQVRQGAFVFMAVSIFAHGYGAAKFIRLWLALNREIDQIVFENRPPPAGYGVLSFKGDTVNLTAGEAQPSEAWLVASANVADQVILRAPRFDLRRIVFDLRRIVPPSTRASQKACDMAKAVEHARRGFGPDTLALLRGYICGPSEFSRAPQGRLEKRTPQKSAAIHF